MKFEQMFDLELAIRGAKGMQAVGIDPETRERAKNDAARHQAELFALVGTLTTEEAAAYSSYRLQQMAA